MATETTRLSAKGQVILPKAIRDAHGWSAGTEFAVEEAPGGVTLRPSRPSPPSRLEDVAGCLRYTGRPKTLLQMEKAIAKEAKERRDRGRCPAGGAGICAF
ncbi:MAG: AbrB/MazE/SpoVT family DNA-binding domain-containing protein [Bryobacteraceae bacterium]|jgi:AbrB family looped-hinge helix DNA binding protein